MFVGPFICLSEFMITQKVMNGSSIVYVGGA